MAIAFNAVINAGWVDFERVVQNTSGLRSHLHRLFPVSC